MGNDDKQKPKDCVTKYQCLDKIERDDYLSNK